MKVVTYLGSLIQLCGGRKEHCKQISLVCVGSAHSVWTTLGLSQLMAHYVSPFYTAQAPVALQGICPKRALGFVHFPGPSSSGNQVIGKCTVPGGLCLNHLPSPNHLVSWVHSKSANSGVLCVSSGELISGCDPPGRCQPSRIPGRLG